ncbi:MAG: MerR family transcriptional regulator [Novosphingobium sp.]|nr:MerR family transcriptional regulator [Novosphingobium sp.]
MASDPRFNDGKEPDALRTIGEVAQALGIKQHVLRYWEQQFPMLKPLKRSGGRRYYRAEDVRIVDTIDRLVNREGYTLKGARLALQGGAKADPAASAAAAPSAAAARTDVLPQLRAIRGRLAAALES